MKSCIITIGDELLQGFTRDTNSEWLSQTLIKYDIKVDFKITIPDDKDKIIQSIDQITRENFDYIFITGGLGPTHDDITRNSLTTFFKTSTELVPDHHEKLVEYFNNRKIPLPINLKSQSTILKGSQPITNEFGSALGMAIRFNKSQIFIMPGVPVEMIGMMEQSILPQYFRKSDGPHFITLSSVGRGESKIAEEISDIIQSYKNKIKFAFLPQHTGVNIRLKNLSDDLNLLREAADEIKIRLKELVFSDDDETIENVVGKLLAEKKYTISTAESCTGGLISKKLTDFPGSSNYFRGSIIAYHNDVKKSILQISPNILDQFGAVSDQTAQSMAATVKKLTGSTIGISTTGISGPTGGTLQKPIGLVFIGIAFGDKVFSGKYQFLKNRELHRETTCTTALNLVRLLLLEKLTELV